MIDSRDQMPSSAYANGRYKEELPLLYELAKQDNVEALLLVAWTNETGAAGENDTEKAIISYRRAADLGSCDALYRLGRIFEKSDDMECALKVFEAGASQDHLPCISALGLLLLKSSESPEKTRIGMDWLNRAADRGHIFARKKLIFLRLEETNSLVFVLCSFVTLTLLRLEYLFERKRDKYSDKII